MIQRLKSVLLVLSGPSGVGKRTVRDEMKKLVPQLPVSISCTTRPLRREDNEVDGVHYWFLTREAFEAAIEAGEFLEWAEVAGNLYGTRKAQVDARLAAGEDLLLELDVQGGASIKRLYPDAVLVFVMPPDWATLESRLINRGSEDAASLQLRLGIARDELRFGFEHYEYLIVNHTDRAEEAACEVAAIYHAECARRTRLGWSEVDD